MPTALFILLLATTAFAQVEERCRGQLLVTFTPGDSRLAISDGLARQPAWIDVTAGAAGPLVHLADLAISEAGSFAAAGSWSATNSGLVLLDAYGQPVRTVDTWPFIPAKLVFGPHGIIWIYGGRQPELRCYSPAGEHIGTATLPAGAPDVPTYLGASNSRIGLWFAGTSRWLEFAPDARLAAAIDLGPPPVLDTRVILTAANEIYGGSGQFLYLFDRRENRWVTAAELIPDPFPGTLLGADGPRLIFRTDGRRLVFLPH